MGGSNPNVVLVKSDGTRTDGRKLDELRPIKITAGVLERADGSAYIEWGNNKVYVGVYGPREVHPRHDQSPSKAIVRCRYSMAPFSVDDRKRPGPDRRSQEISKVISEAFSAVVFTEQFPRTAIDVFMEVVQADAGTRCAAMTAAAVAMADAGIPMRDLVVAVASGKINGKIALDLNKIEDNFGESDCPMGIVPSTGEIVLLQMDGHLTRDEWEQALAYNQQAVKVIYELQKQALRDRWAKAAEAEGEPEMFVEGAREAMVGGAEGGGFGGGFGGRFRGNDRGGRGGGGGGFRGGDRGGRGGGGGGFRDRGDRGGGGGGGFRDRGDRGGGGGGFRDRGDRGGGGGGFRDRGDRGGGGGGFRDRGDRGGGGGGFRDRPRRDDGPRDDAPQGDGPAGDAPQGDGPRDDAPRDDAPRDAPQGDAPREGGEQREGGSDRMDEFADRDRMGRGRRRGGRGGGRAGGYGGTGGRDRERRSDSGDSGGSDTGGDGGSGSNEGGAQ